MRTIVFPTDFSLNSIHAIRYGINLFEGQDVRFILFNSYVDPSVGASMTYVFEEHMKEISMTMLKKVYEELKDEYGFSDLQMELVNRYGDLPYALKPLLEEENVDLVVMGSSGASGANISIFGSNSYATMKDAPCPVLAVPLQTPISRPERIGLASEEELSGDEEILEPLYALARLHGAWVMGIHVSKKKSVVDADAEERTLFGNDRLPYIDLKVNDPLKGIELAIGENKIDLLSIIIPKRSLLDRIFHKSVSKQIAKQVSIPILALHAK
ncbi:MAG: universal stress protein [Flavobacteriales bacterium]|nr:universal stress protein [Flavobacteriales bacterium]